MSDTVLDLKAAIGEDTERLIKRAQDLLCQSHGKAVSLDKKDPILRAEKAMKRKAKKEIPSRDALKHQVVLRDRDRCQAQDPDGSTCHDSRWTDLHHRTPVSEGGQNIIENIVTLCRSHHQMEHDWGRSLT